MSLACIPRAVGVLDLIFSGASALPSRMIMLMWIPMSVPGLSFLHLFTCYPSSLGISHPRWSEVTPQSSFTLHSPVVKDGEHLRTYLLIIRGFFWEWSVQTHYLLKAGSLWFCYWVAPCAFGAISNSKHSLQSSRCLSTLWVTLLAMWKWLALLWSHLFIFVFVSCVWESHENTHFPSSVQKCFLYLSF